MKVDVLWFAATRVINAVCLIHPFVSFFVFATTSASAAWLTGGSVDKIEVYQNEGGVAHFRGGIRPCIIPAGYVGVSFWGGCFVALSGGRVPATVAASFFCFALLICLRWVFLCHVFEDLKMCIGCDGILNLIGDRISIVDILPTSFWYGWICLLPSSRWEPFWSIGFSLTLSFNTSLSCMVPSLGGTGSWIYGMTLFPE